MSASKPLDPEKTICICYADGKEVGRIAATDPGASKYLERMNVYYHGLEVKHVEDEAAAKGSRFLQSLFRRFAGKPMFPTEFTVEVELLSKMQGGTLRVGVSYVKRGGAIDILNAVYVLGQTITTGDVINLNGGKYLVASFGFLRLSEDEYRQYVGLPQDERITRAAFRTIGTVVPE